MKRAPGGKREAGLATGGGAWSGLERMNGEEESREEPQPGHFILRSVLYIIRKGEGRGRKEGLQLRPDGAWDVGREKETRRAASWSGWGVGRELNLSALDLGRGLQWNWLPPRAAPVHLRHLFSLLPPFRFSSPRCQAAQGSIHRARSRWRGSRLSPSLAPHWGGFPPALGGSGGTSCSPPRRAAVRARFSTADSDGTARGPGPPRCSAAAAPRRLLRRRLPPPAQPSLCGQRSAAAASGPGSAGPGGGEQPAAFPARLGPPGGRSARPSAGLGEGLGWRF